MKALLVNPGHSQTFWSFNNVLSMLGKKALMPPLGLLTVAALLPPEWELQLVDQTFQAIAPEDWEACELVLISWMVVQHQGILETTREAKRRGKTVVVGGPWVFHFPEEALGAGADLVVQGELESALPLLLQALAAKRFPQVLQAPEPADMESSPPPRYDLINLNHYTDMTVQFSRGCPFHCEFCDVTLMLGRRVRTKTPRQILQELDVLFNLGWKGAVFFVDDNFIGNPVKVKALLRELLPWMRSRRYPFDFYTQASVNLANDPELLELMVQTGFFSVFLGIETPDVESLKLTGKVQNAAVDLDQVCRTINRAGLQIIAGCIIGFDNERPGAGRRLLDFARRNQIPEMFITLLQAGPGTDLYHRLQREDRLLAMDSRHLSNQTGLVNFVPTRPLAQIVDEFILLYDILYEPTAYLKRTTAYFARMQPLKLPKALSLPSHYQVRAVLLLVLRQGILKPSRRQFWKSLITAAWNFPERLRFFLSLCVKLEHYSQYRQTIATVLRQQMAQLASAPTAVPPEGTGAPDTAPRKFSQTA